MRLLLRSTLVLCVLALSAVAAPRKRDVPAICLSNEVVTIDQVCTASHLNDPAAGTAPCSGLNVVGQVAVAFQPPKCNTYPDQAGGMDIPPTEDGHGTILPQDLPDMRSHHTGMPQTLDHKHFMKAEGATYYWYFRNLLNFENFAPCPFGNTTQHVDLPLPDGWTDMSFFDLKPPEPTPPGATNDSLPFALLLRPDPSYVHKRRDSCKRWYAAAAKASELARISKTKATTASHTIKEAGLLGERAVPTTPAQRLQRMKQAATPAEAPQQQQQQQQEAPRYQPMQEPREAEALGNIAPEALPPRQPAPQQPAPQQPAPQQPTVQQPAPQQPAVQPPARQQPASQQPGRQRVQRIKSEQPAAAERPTALPTASRHTSIPRPYGDEQYPYHPDQQRYGRQEGAYYHDDPRYYSKGPEEPYQPHPYEVDSHEYQPRPKPHDTPYHPDGGNDYYREGPYPRDGGHPAEQPYYPGGGAEEHREQDEAQPRPGYYEGHEEREAPYYRDAPYYKEGHPAEQYHPEPPTGEYYKPEPKPEQYYHPEHPAGEEYHAPKQYYPAPEHPAAGGDYHKPEQSYYPAPDHPSGGEEYHKEPQYYPAPEHSAGEEGYPHKPEPEPYYPEAPAAEEEHPHSDHEDEVEGVEDGYAWESDRYSEDYSCGKDDAEGTSPHLILLLRGALTLQEYALGLAYNQGPGEFGPGNYSAGYAYVAQYLWSTGLGEVIAREIDNGCRSVTIAGHSLGGAVGQLLAVAIEGLFKAMDEATYGYKFEGAKPARVTVITFGSPNVGDATWADNFNKKINTRQVVFEGDLIAQIACTPQMIGCDEPNFPKTTPGPWPYTRTGGNIVFPGSAMPFSSKYNVEQSWSALTKVTGAQLCAPTYPAAVVATHVCSYLCMTSQCLGGEENNMCWLDASQSPAYGASQCNFAGIVGGVPRLS